MGESVSTPTVRNWYRWVTSWWDLPRSAVYRLNLQVFTRLARSYHWCEMLCWPWGSGCRQECVWTSYSDIRLHQSVPHGFKKWLQHECHRSAKFESLIHQHDIEQCNCGKWNLRIQQRHGYHSPQWYIYHTVWDGFDVSYIHDVVVCTSASPNEWNLFVEWVVKPGGLALVNWTRGIDFEKVSPLMKRAWHRTMFPLFSRIRWLASCISLEHTMPIAPSNP